MNMNATAQMVTSGGRGCGPDRRCCERDHNNDGNCDKHQSPGVMRNENLRIANILTTWSKPELVAEIEILRELLRQYHEMIPTPESTELLSR